MGPQGELDHLLEFDLAQDDEQYWEAKQEDQESVFDVKSEDFQEHISDQNRNSEDDMPLSSLKKKKRNKRGPYKKNPEFGPRHCHVLGCNKVFLRPGSFQHHLQTHNAKVCFGCGLKDIDMTTDEWDKHETEFHLGKCQLCPLLFHDLKSMRQHHKNDHNGHQIKCPKCERQIKLN